jgi:hypothetical protein
LKKENEEVISATSSQGDTSFVVCKTNEENNTQTCVDFENPEPLSTKASGGKVMLDNNTYDLMEQLLIENRSLWRIKNNYKTDSAMDKETREVWSYIEKDKEDLVKMLTEKLKERL